MVLLAWPSLHELLYQVSSIAHRVSGLRELRSALHFIVGVYTYSHFAMCRRAMLEEGDSLDASPLLVTGLILESLGNVGEAAVSDGFTFFSSP